MEKSKIEIHSEGTCTEINLSRALAREISQITEQYGNVVPENVMQAYRKLRNHYEEQMLVGRQ